MGLVAVVDGGGVLRGVFSDGDVRRQLCAGRLDAAAPIGEHMTVSPRRASTGDSSALVLDVMERNEITVLPVVRADGTLAGMVHLHDLLGKGALKFSNGHGGRSS